MLNEDENPALSAMLFQVFKMITVYVLQGRNNKRYVGITNNLERRLNEHKSGASKAGQLLKDFHLLHTEVFQDYPSARKREKFLKSGQGREFLNKLYPRSRSTYGS